MSMIYLAMRDTISQRRRRPFAERAGTDVSGTGTYEASWFDTVGRRHTENFDLAAAAQRIWRSTSLLSQ